MNNRCYKDTNIVRLVNKRKKEKRSLKRLRIRTEVMKYLGLHDRSTNIGIALSIHNKTGWPIPGKNKLYSAFISKFYHAFVLKKEPIKKDYKKQSSDEFYRSKQWKELRYTALSMSEGKCNLCGATAHDGVKLHVDHIKPRSKNPELSLDLDNLSVLCDMCNIGKSNYDDFDYRNKF